jgi:catechol 2,3-dioxygenase-like lactoylglutathione lyase family enzyme
MSHRRITWEGSVPVSPLLAKRRLGYRISMRLAGVCLGTDDLAAGERAYELLLGVPPVSRNRVTVRFALRRGSVELFPSRTFRALRFVEERPGMTRVARGVLVVISGESDQPPPVESAIAIDHVVVHTIDPEAAIATWRDQMGMRLALDREFPDRHLRLLFFRSGGITLEYASPLPAAADRTGEDRIHGVSYRVTDLAARRERLLAAGVDVSELRPGMRPGTTVATVRSGTEDVPTLLLQVDA